MASKSDDEAAMQEEDEKCEETEKGAKKRQRVRKQRIYEQIKKQMEFYFSDANITKQRVMKDIVKMSEFVPLALFIEKFNKISSLAKDLDTLRKALKYSEKLELSSDGSGVRRIIPFDESKVKSEEEVEKCTIYVENIPLHVNHEWIESSFQEFGPVAYVSLPKFKKTGQIKGFAFVEFEEAESAQRCLEAYGEIGACLPTSIDPSTLLSISTFNQEEGEGGNNKKYNLRKRNAPKNPVEDEAKGESGVEEEEVPPKKIKKNEEEEEEDKNNGNDDSKPNSHRDTHQAVPSKKLENDEEMSSNNDKNKDEVEDKNGDGEPIIEEKKKKKRKRNKARRELVNEEKLENDLIHLKILPKRNWRQLRNRYLNLQRENMAKLKAQIRRRDNMAKVKAQLKSSLDPSFPQQHSMPPDSNDIKVKSICVRIEFSPDNMPENEESFQDVVKNRLAPPHWSNFIKYIDYEIGRDVGYVRLDGGGGAQEGVKIFMENAQKEFSTATLMTEEETDKYWSDLKKQLKENQKGKGKKRGKERLLNQATKYASSHIRFEDGDEKNSIVPSNV